MTKTIRIGVSALAAGVVAISGAMSVQAADMSGRGAAPAPAKKYVPAYGYDHMSKRSPARAGYPAPVAARRQTDTSWTGVYAGGNVGYDWARSEMLGSENTTTSLENEFAVDLMEGLMYGGQVGYNVALDDNIIVGIEGDFSWTEDMERTEVQEGPTVYKFKTSLPWIASVRARVGSAIDNYMVYGTGGITFADLEHSAVVEDTNGAAFTITTDKRVSGWAVGGGVEVMLSDNLTTRLEYLYHDLGENPYKFKASAGSFDEGKEVNNKLSMHAVRMGVNLKF